MPIHDDAFAPIGGRNAPVMIGFGFVGSPVRFLVVTDSSLRP